MDKNAIVDSAFMGNDANMYALFDYLREHDPVAYIDHPEFLPFWSLSRYDDIKAIGSANDRFLSAPRTVLMPSAVEDMWEAKLGTRNGLETLIHMDRPKHLKLRRVTREWFLPRNMENLRQQMEKLAREFVDKMEDMGGECDFVKDVALLYPLRVIMQILGVPEEDELRMLKLTQELFGGNDPEQQRGEDMGDMYAVVADFFNYFNAIIDERKKNPTGDLASVIANAEVDGEPMDNFDQISYFIISATAGHDTTSASIGGGMHALMQQPEQITLWRDNPDLDMNAAKEMIRWTSPVRHMVRTATEDLELHGKQIRKGDNIALWFPAANRDPQAIENPNKLDVTRDTKSHLAFGYGSHMCLGQHLATMELAIFFRELLPRLKDIAPNGDPEWLQAIFVGGLKSMPVSYRF
jgi:cytochrome P450